MKKFTLEKLVEAAEECKKKMATEPSLEKRELFSRAYAEIADILVEEIYGKTME
jgi:hypothetical protein